MPGVGLKKDFVLEFRWLVTHKPFPQKCNRTGKNLYICSKSCWRISINIHNFRASSDLMNRIIKNENWHNRCTLITWFEWKKCPRRSKFKKYCYFSRHEFWIMHLALRTRMLRKIFQYLILSSKRWRNEKINCFFNGYIAFCMCEQQGCANSR